MDLLVTLNGQKRFSKLDLSYVYQQLLLYRNYKEFLRVNTYKGLFQQNRLQYGVHSQTGIFQREMGKSSSRILLTIF